MIRVMNIKHFVLLLSFIFVAFCVGNAQSPSPSAAESPSPAKHKSHKKAEASPAGSPEL
jgi:hypothetical protein